MTMTNEIKWKLCSDMIGRVLTYLDEEESSRGTKMAVKSEIWNFYNATNGDDNDNTQERTGNR